MDLADYQQRATETDITKFDPTDERFELIPLLGLVDEAASIVTEYKKYLVDGDHYRIYKERLTEEIGDLLWYLAAFSTKVDVRLEDAALRNLEKTQARFISDGKSLEPLDSTFPGSERLPEVFEVTIRPQKNGSTVMLFDGKELGNPLTDNAYRDDGYRYHDVLHWAYVAYLGWSPVIRRMLKRKRKSNAKIDEIEDGARAAVIEEAISALAFSNAESYDFFLNSNAVESKLLRNIEDITAHLEVRNRALSKWEQAILGGFKVWRQVRDAEGGTFRGDFRHSSFEFVRRLD